ncbi:hypothetical protein [Paenibacillus sp. MMO-58]
MNRLSFYFELHLIVRNVYDYTDAFHFARFRLLILICHGFPLPACYN